MKKQIQFRGETINYSNQKDLLKKTKLSKSQLKDLLNGNTKRYLCDKNNKCYEYDFKDSPMLFRELGIKRIPSSKIASNNVKIKGYDILNNLPASTKYKNNLSLTLSLEVIATYIYDEKEIDRDFTIKYAGNINDLPNFVINELENRIPTLELSRENPLTVIIKDSATHEILDEKQLLLEKENPISLENYFTNVDNNGNKNCVPAYFKKYASRLLKEYPELFPENEKYSIQRVFEICEQYKYPIKIVDKHGNIILQQSHNSRDLPYLNICAWDNHAYGSQKGMLKINKSHSQEKKIVENIHKELHHIINVERRLPKNITYGKKDIISFDDLTTHFIQNSEYDRCYKILKAFENKDFKVDNKIYDKIKLGDLMHILEEKYVKKNINSFLPESHKFVLPSFIFRNDEIDYDLTFKTADIVLAYSTALKNLTFLIVTDIRINKVLRNLSYSDLIGHYLYIVKPKKSSILLPTGGLSSGEHLLYCRKFNLEFEIIEGLECTYTPNYYTQLLIDMKNVLIDGEALTHKERKDMANIHIGRMEPKLSITYKKVAKGIYNYQECSTKEGFAEQLTGDYYIKYELQDVIANLYTKKPIACQIKEYNRRMMWEFIQENDLKRSTIKQINVDSITYKGNLPSNLKRGEMDFWKEENYKPLSYAPEPFYEPLTFLTKIKNENQFFDCPAGRGKTTFVINKIIPKYTDYLVFGPTHVSIEPYKVKGFNCQVIEWAKIPKEETIIIDEIGMIGKHGQDLIFKCFYLGKKIIALGDFNQLLPVEDSALPYNSPDYLKYIYSIPLKLKTNHRNHFTDEYYRSLYESTDKTYLFNEIKKYSTTDFRTAEKIICYENSTRQLYNDLMLSENNQTIHSIGLKVICKTNDLQQYNLYNNFEYVITNKSDEEITLNNITIPLKKYNNKGNFEPAYALTLYSVQSKSLSSYYFAEEDKQALARPRSAYTLISRLKTK